MAFHLTVWESQHVLCDICEKPGKLITMRVGSSRYDKQMIQAHENCLIRKIELANKRYQAEVLAQGGQ